MKALVIGASGCIGANVARALVAKGHEVRALARAKSDRRAIAGLECERVDGDVEDRSSIERAATGCGWVFDCAGYYPTVSLDHDLVLRTGVRRTRNVLAACAAKGVARIVHTSSLSTIGPPGEASRLADERDLYLPGSAGDGYYEVKWAMEQEAFRAAAEGLPVVVVNPTVTIGPFDPKPTGGRLVLSVARRAVPAYVEGTVNVVHAGDVGLGQVAAAERSRVGSRTILGGENWRVSDLLRMIAEEAGVEPPRVPIPGPAARGLAVASELIATYVTRRPPLLPLEGVDMLLLGQPLSTSRMQRDLGISPRPAREAIRDALAWFRENGRLEAGA